MIAKRTTRNRNMGNQQSSRKVGEKFIPSNNVPIESATKNSPNQSGSRFTVFGEEEEGGEELFARNIQGEPGEIVSSGREDNLENNTEANSMVIEEKLQQMATNIFLPLEKLRTLKAGLLTV